MQSNIYVLVGPSGSGKTTIANELADLGLPSLVSHTTRAARTGETEGKDYYFVNDEEFNQINFMEKVVYAGKQYGLSEKEIDRALRRTMPSVVVMDISGALQLRRLCGDRAKLIAILATENEIQERMLARGDSQENVTQRISNAFECGEFDNWRVCDYAIKNNSIRSSVNQALAIIDLDCAQQRYNA